ncbi:sensor histidine kinase [Spirosoma validum]|uniref:histidine kinase n=1 Tax=Spirosoma validum TaxID=2771355 RepID=A0A927GED2_9BACT|nr:HAMP domain-containing sensor histidine kinase [Spirosoma validum]MBD2754717.1 HAMP domain-containing histidine kinase [Spirosoma validum]
MSKQRIRWIVILMAVGLLGLVGLQLYWISSALKLQKEQFAYKVTDALQEVVRTLERQEIVYLTRQRYRAREQQSRLMSIAKKENKPLTPNAAKPRASITETSPIAQNKRPDHSFNPAGTTRQMMSPSGGAAGTVVVQSDILHPTVHPLSPEQMAVVEEFFRQQEELMAVGDWQTQLEQQHLFDRWVENVLTNELPRINNQAGQLSHYKDSLARAAKKRMQAVQPRKNSGTNITTSSKESSPNRLTSTSQHSPEDKSDIVKDVLKGVFLSDRPIEDRVNRLVLDTLLRQSLAERGISIPFAYAVRTQKHPKFLFTSLGMETQQFDADGYKAALFPNNLLEGGNYVYVYFPTQQQFILSRLGFTFGASVVLILVILACFYIAISTIVKQKKLADIKNDFINNMTHEFKTPISTISLAVEMAQEQLRSDPVTQKNSATSVESTDRPDLRLTRYMGIIRDETRRLGSHVEKVLQMALLDRGEIKLNFSPVNIHDVIEKVLNNMSLQIEQRGGEVDLNFDADREVVEADELHLTNIVYNLLDNALKYSPDSPHIALTTRSLPEGVSITVTDQGVGMTKDQTSRIFEKFYRVPTGNRHDVKGFGLGLSYVKKMIDEHHGQIKVESQPGIGSSFEVILPYKVMNE